MYYGGHVREIEDIGELKSLGMDFGEVVIKNEASRSYWGSNKISSNAGDGFFLLAHGPHEGNPNSLENLEKNYLPALRETVLTARRMGINFLTTHLWMDSRYVSAEIISAKIRALNELREFGRQEGVTVSLENLSESRADLEAILSVIPDLALTLDIGHAELLTDLNRSFEIISDFGHSIKHLHVHDNRGGVGVKDDLHLPLGEGIIDFEGIFRELHERGYDRTITLELKPEEIKSSLIFLRNLIDRIAKTSAVN